MGILPLIAIALVVLFIYSWQRSRPKLRAGKRRRSGLYGLDSLTEASTQAAVVMLAVHAETKPRGTKPRCRTRALCIIDTISCPSASRLSQAG